MYHQLYPRLARLQNEDICELIIDYLLDKKNICLRGNCGTQHHEIIELVKAVLQIQHNTILTANLRYHSLPDTSSALNSLIRSAQALHTTLKDTPNSAPQYSQIPPGSEPNEILKTFRELQASLSQTDTCAVLFIDGLYSLCEEQDSVEFVKIHHAIAAELTHIILVLTGNDEHAASKVLSGTAFGAAFKNIQVTPPTELETIDHLKKHSLTHPFWRKALTDLDCVLIHELTLGQPTYVNDLCDKLWTLSYTPNTKTIMGMWRGIVNEALERGLSSVFLTLNPTQKRLIQDLAKSNDASLDAGSLIDLHDWPSIEIQKAIERLHSLNITKIDRHGSISLVNPIVRSVALNH
ncbi:hypothetical protein F7U66_00490 [Vibrio parahaemolyticus]|nr:hypothetical protein [Vibrio parahaemolyticus]